MGEARRRGTFEERKKFSILKQEKKRLEDKLKEDLYFQSLSEEEKIQYIKRNKNTKFFLNMALSLLSDFKIRRYL